MTHPSGKRDLGGEYQSAITGMLADTWDWYVQSGISPLSPQHAIHKLSRYKKEKYPEGVQNWEQMVSLFDDPEYARLSEEATSGVIDPSGGLLGTVRKVAPKVAARAIPKDPMIVQHNINPDTLPRVERMGGIPAPSMAISKVDDPLTEFGGVSLLGGPEMAKPSAKNPIWSTDAYTARTPQIEVEPNAKLLELVKKRFGEVWNPDHNEVMAARMLINPNFQGIYSNVPITLRVGFLKSVGLGKILPKKPKILRGPNNNKYHDEVWNDNKRNEEEYADAVGDVWRDYGEKTNQAHQNSQRRRQEFESWILRQKKSLLKEGGGFTERIFRGYTNMGNRRYAPATLENVVKEMKGGAGGENWSGAGLLRAAVTQPFKSFAGVKKARGKITSKDIYDLSESHADNLLSTIQTEAGEYLSRFPEYRPSQDFDRVIEEFTGDLVRGRKPFDYLGGPLDVYKRFVAEVPDSLKNKAKELREIYQNMPTKYFEIKPQRGVALSEFKGAIVPGNLPKHQLKILKDAGIKKIHKYSNHTERNELVKKYPELMFLAPPVVGAGLLADQEGVQ